VDLDHVPDERLAPSLPPVDPTCQVAIRVASLCLGADGRLSPLLLCDTAVRGALLLDLALSGRVESAEDSIVVDATPTGFAPADGLLAAIAVEPERSLDGWLDEKRIRLRDVAAACVASGRWLARPGPLGFRRRFTDLHRAQTLRDRARRPEDDAESPSDACVAAVAAAAGLQDLEQWSPGARPENLIRATGLVAWLADAVVDHLVLTGARYRAQASALGAGTVGPF
jgi:hypothetical protein